MHQPYSDHITADDIRTSLSARYADVEIFYHDVIDSTNTEAKRLLAGGLAADAIITAAAQTNGRGRLGRSFHSPADTGIYVSYVLHPAGALQDLVSLTAAAAVAVDRAIRSLTDAEPQIKWVNDLYLDGKKICGILAETVTHPAQPEKIAVIIGIGLNLTTDGFPKELTDIVGALPAPGVKKSRMIAAIAEELYALASNPADRSYMEEYRAHSLVLDRRVVFLRDGQPTTAWAIGIDDMGGLIVRLDDGTETVLFTGEISLRLSD